MSLSRSGLTFALAGVAAWVLLTRRTGDRRPLWALGLVALSFMVWIGIEPLLGRFENLEEQWLLEQGRTAVWRDSVPAVGDFWLTGLGIELVPLCRRRVSQFRRTDLLQLGAQRLSPARDRARPSRRSALRLDRGRRHRGTRRGAGGSSRRRGAFAFALGVSSPPWSRSRSTASPISACISPRISRCSRSFWES